MESSEIKSMFRIMIKTGDYTTVSNLLKELRSKDESESALISQDDIILCHKIACGYPDTVVMSARCAISLLCLSKDGWVGEDKAVKLVIDVCPEIKAFVHIVYNFPNHIGREDFIKQTRKCIMEGISNVNSYTDNQNFWENLGEIFHCSPEVFDGEFINLIVPIILMRAQKGVWFHLKPYAREFLFHEGCSDRIDHGTRAILQKLKSFLWETLKAGDLIKSLSVLNSLSGV